MEIAKKDWQNPVLEVLNIDKTMASTNFGTYDEGYNAALDEQSQTGIHHGS